MSCPTCDHTMQKVEDWVYWCPRCGTLGIGRLPKVDGVLVLDSEAPKLVERCRKFRASRHPSFKAEVGIFGDPVLAAEWHRLGIAESINLPGDRPQ